MVSTGNRWETTASKRPRARQPPRRRPVPDDLDPPRLEVGRERDRQGDVVSRASSVAKRQARMPGPAMLGAHMVVGDHEHLHDGCPSSDPREERASWT